MSLHLLSSILSQDDPIQLAWCFGILLTLIFLIFVVVVSRLPREWKKTRLVQQRNKQKVKDIESEGKIIEQILEDNSHSLEECLQSYFKLIKNTPRQTWCGSFAVIIEILQQKNLIEKSQISHMLSILLMLKDDQSFNPSEFTPGFLRELGQREKEKNQRLESGKEQERKRTELFVESEEYDYIRQFARRFENDASDDELTKLQSLLSKYGHSFPIERLESFIAVEMRLSLQKSIDERIFSKNPSSVDEAIRIFLEYYNPDDRDNLDGFAYELRKKEMLEMSTESLASAIRRVQREIQLEQFEKQLKETDKLTDIETVDQLTGYEFEKFLGGLFSNMGYSVKETRLSGDQGADLVVEKHGEVTVVQAKRSLTNIGNKAVQEVLASMSFYGARSGMVVTNQYFTRSATELAEANGIKMVDRNDLNDWLLNFR